MNHHFLSWAVLAADLTVKAMILIGVAWIAARLARRAPAAARHMIWMAALSTILLLPALEAVAPRLTLFTIPEETPVAKAVEPIPAAIDLQEPTLTVDDAEVALATPQPQSTPAHPVNLVLWAEGAWAGGCAVVLLSAVLGWVALSRINARVLPLPSSVTPSGGRRIRLKVSREGRPPSALTWGAICPTILLPRASESWPPERLETVLLHELEHIRRWDAAKQLVGIAACAMYWFNPFVWLAARAARSEAEAATDDAVLRRGVRPSAYAHTLMEVAAEIGRGHRLISPTGVAFMKKSKIEARLRAILDGRTRRGITRTEKAAAMSVAFALIVPLAFVRAAAVAPFAALPQSGNEPTVVIKVVPKANAQKRLTKKQLEAQRAHHLRALAAQAKLAAHQKQLAEIAVRDSGAWMGLTEDQLKQAVQAGQLEEAKAAVAASTGELISAQAEAATGVADAQPATAALTEAISQIAKADTVASTQDAFKSADLALKIADTAQIKALQDYAKVYEVKRDSMQHWVTTKDGGKPLWKTQSGKYPTVSWQSDVFAHDAKNMRTLVYRLDPKSMTVFVNPMGRSEFRISPGTVVTKKLLAEHSIYGVNPEPLSVLVQSDPTSRQQRKVIEEQRRKALEEARAGIARAEEDLRRAMELARNSQDPTSSRKLDEEKRALEALEAQKRALEAQHRDRAANSRLLLRNREAQRASLLARSKSQSVQREGMLRKLEAERTMVRAQRDAMRSQRREMLRKMEAERSALTRVRSQLREENLRRDGDPAAKRARLERERDALRARLRAIEDELNKGSKR